MNSMKFWTFTFLAISATFVIAADTVKEKEAAAKKELEHLAGRWSIVSSIRDGNESDSERLASLKIVYKPNGEFHAEFDGIEVATGNVALDPSQKLKTMTMKLKTSEGEEQKFVGIYELDKDNFRICYARGEDKTAPKEFKSQSGSGHTLSTLKREKAEKKN